MSEYVITDGYRYIKRDHLGKYVPTSSYSLAGKFNKKHADLVYNNNLPKPLKMLFNVKKVEEDDVSPKESLQVVRVNTEDLKRTEKVMECENVQYWLDKISGLNGLATEASERRTRLYQELSNIDKEIEDIEHYIEFKRFNAAQGWRMCSMLKERRVRRRSIKNEINTIDIILGHRIAESVSDKITNSVQKMDSRTYEPRVLKELYDL